MVILRESSLKEIAKLAGLTTKELRTRFKILNLKSLYDSTAKRRNEQLKDSNETSTNTS